MAHVHDDILIFGKEKAFNESDAWIAGLRRKVSLIFLESRLQSLRFSPSFSGASRLNKSC